MFFAKKTCESHGSARRGSYGNGRRGFSMVEVALALGVTAFALLSLLALLPLGVKSNQISAEETRGAMILTAVEADLRNTHPSLNSSHKSAMFGLDLPYQASGTGVYSFNSTITGPPTSLVSGSNTIALDDAENPVAIGSAVRNRYQISVIYLPPPANAPLSAMQARLVVSWPSLATSPAPIADVTSLGKVGGYLETVVSFPAP